MEQCSRHAQNASTASSYTLTLAHKNSQKKTSVPVVVTFQLHGGKTNTHPKIKPGTQGHKNKDWDIDSDFEAES